MRALATKHPRYGYRRVRRLLERVGWKIGVGKAQRLWRREGLRVPEKRRKRRRLGDSANGSQRRQATAPNEVWAYDFVMDENVGLPGIIDYLNLWSNESDRVGNLLIIRYEDMRIDPAAVLSRVMEFVNGEPAKRDAIDDAVEYASVENMRKLEEKSTFWLAGSRMRPGKKGDPNSYKVRRAKVGGYTDYFSEDEIAKIDALVAETLSSDYGYDAPPEPDTRATAQG